MIASAIGRIPLEPGDIVVAITWFRDIAIVVTAHGAVYRLILEGTEL
jgi:hypothetical protein